MLLTGRLSIQRTLAACLPPLIQTVCHLGAVSLEADLGQPWQRLLLIFFFGADLFVECSLGHVFEDIAPILADAFGCTRLEDIPRALVDVIVGVIELFFAITKDLSLHLAEVVDLIVSVPASFWTASEGAH